MNEKINADIHQPGTGTRDWAISADTFPALVVRGLMTVGYTSLGAGYQVVRNLPRFAHIGACLQGHVEYLIDGRWQRVGAGTVLVAPAGVPHGSRAISLRTPDLGRFGWVLFDTCVKRPSQRREWDRGNARLISPRDVRPLWWALQGLYAEATAHQQVDAAAIAEWCNVVVGAATRLASSEHVPVNPLRQVWEEADLDLRRPWTASQLAGMANLSQTHFRRICHASLGVSPLRYLTQLRMRRAAMLLTTTQDKLIAIAEAVGYTDVFAFSAAFKRYAGISPCAYRGVKQPG